MEGRWPIPVETDFFLFAHYRKLKGWIIAATFAVGSLQAR
jgi:hypothetical protein